MQDYPFDVDTDDQKDGGGDEKQPSFWSALNKSQKISVVVLIVFATLMIVVWAVEFKRGLTEPFAYKDDGQQQVDTSANNADTNNEAALKSKDTDSDGLSDWDELNIYKTSPYLEDSDSDGIKDGAEVKNGTDPNCPEGRICYGAGGTIVNPFGSATTSNDANQATTSQSQNQDLSNALKGTSLNSQQVKNEDLQKLIEGGLDAANLRRVLKESGMDERLLNQYSDQQLMEFYKNTYSGKK